MGEFEDQPPKLKMEKDYQTWTYSMHKTQYNQEP
jgi:hypothetical protein